ncbi:MAG: hypothetical protein M3512_10555, partial [Bacteroidota bacterium]|nr:hypothetical protein [Bacteroidota bacterium]
MKKSWPMPTRLVVLLAFSLLALAPSLQAQNFPVQASTQLIPPYAVYLSDYATPGNEKLRVILV